MSTELTVLNGGSLAGAESFGFDAVAELFKPEPLTLVQPTSEGVDGFLPGSFLDKSTGQTFTDADGKPMVRFIPMMIHPTRKKYLSDKFVPGEKPICMSRDGVYPILGTERNGLTPLAGQCTDPETGKALCEHASWDRYDNKTKTGDKPTCSEHWKLVFVEVETSIPYFHVASKTQSRTARNLFNSIRKNALMEEARNKRTRRISIFDYIVTMKSVKAKTGPYYDLFFPRVELMRQEQVQQYFDVYQRLVTNRQKLDEAMEAAAESGEGQIIDGETGNGFEQA